MGEKTFNLIRFAYYMFLLHSSLRLQFWIGSSSSVCEVIFLILFAKIRCRDKLSTLLTYIFQQLIVKTRGVSGNA